MARLLEWTRAGETVGACCLAWFGFLCGPTTAQQRALLDELLDADRPAMTPESSALAAQLFNVTGRRSRSQFDCLIAASAIVAGDPLASANATHFRPFEPHGLRLLAITP
jgi:predicted nucleic acid-binding protein